jgi:DNA-directed RNA polymerase alpha subunit
MKTLSDALRELAVEFESDRDYRTEEARESFRSRLISAMYRAAASLEDGQRRDEAPPPADELDVLGLDTRTLNVLRKDRLVTIAQLAKVTDAYLMRTPNFGPKSLRGLRAKVPYVPEGKPRVRVQAVMGHA